MASGTSVKKHKCSCGRSFRHAISLKRHQNVTGCDAAALESATADDVAQIEKLKVKPKRTAAPTVAVASEAIPAAVSPSVMDDRTIVITPELVASWQEQTGFNRRPQSLIDSIAPKQAEPKVDWVQVAETSKEFVSFCGEVRTSVFSVLRTLTLLAGRGALFLCVLAGAGWLLVSGVSASDSGSALDADSRSQLTAQTIVQDFLQNARLNQYDRARLLLSPSARDSVSAEQLQIMINSLPLNEEPTSWKTELSSDGKNAWVTIARCGVNEVYTVTQSERGWGVASVSLSET